MGMRRSPYIGLGSIHTLMQSKLNPILWLQAEEERRIQET